MATEEYELIRAKIHWCVYVKPVLIMILLIVIAAATGVGGIILVAILVGVVNLALTILKYKMQSLIVTNQKVFGSVRHGFLYLASDELNVRLDKVDNASTKNGILGGIFGYGTVRIASNSRQFVWSHVANYRGIVEVLNNAQDDYDMRGSNQISNTMQQVGQQQIQMMQAQTIAQMNMLGMIAGNQQAQLAGTAQMAIQQGRENVLPDNIIDSRQQALPLNDSASRPAAMSERERLAIENAKKNPTAGRVVRRDMKNPMWQKDCPIIISRAFIADANENKQIDLNLEIVNLKPRNIIAIYLDIKGYNVLKEEKCDLKEVVFLDLNMECGKKYPMPDPIDLPDNTIRSVKIFVRHVVFDDDTIWDYDGDESLVQAEAEQKPIPQEYSVDVQNIGREHLAHKRDFANQKYFCYPKYEEDHWFCACGQFNTGLTCVSCDEDKDVIEQYFNEKYLRKANAERLQQEELDAEERRKQEEEERRRREEEERLRLEKEAAERAAKEEARRQKIENIKSSALTFVDAAGKKTKEMGDKIATAGSNVVQQTGNKMAEAKAAREEKRLEEEQNAAVAQEFEGGSGLAKMRGAEGVEPYGSEGPQADAGLPAQDAVDDYPRFCMNCGHKLSRGDLFCESCGTKVEM